MKTHFIFDFDDTLVASNEFNQDMFYETFTPHFPEVNEQLVRDVHKASVGKSMIDQFQQIIDDLSLDISAKQLMDENEVLHKKNYKKVKAFDYTDRLLDELKKRGNKLSICTNRQRESFKAILENNNLIHFFDHLVSCYDEGFEKPNPQCLLKIMGNENKKNFIYFGDSPTDYTFAKNAGIDSIIINQYLNDKKFFVQLVEAFLN